MRPQHRAPLVAFAAVTVACLLTVYLALTAHLPESFRPSVLAQAPMDLYRQVLPFRITRDLSPKPAEQLTASPAPPAQRLTKTDTSSVQTTAVVQSRAPARHRHHHKSVKRVAKHAGHPHPTKPRHPPKAHGNGHAHGRGHDHGEGHTHGKGHGHGHQSDPIVGATSAAGNLVTSVLQDVTGAAPGNSGNAPGHNKGSDPGHSGSAPGHNKGSGPSQTAVRITRSAARVIERSLPSVTAAITAHGEHRDHEHGHHEHGHAPRSHDEHGHSSWSHGHEHHVSPGRARGRH